MAGLIFGLTGSSSASTKPTTPPSTISVTQLVQAVRQATNQSPDEPAIRIHGRSAVVRQQTGPFIGVGMTKSFPGLNKYRFQLNMFLTAMLKGFVNAHGSLAGLFASSAAGGVCALLVIPLTVAATPLASAIASAIAGPLCGVFVMLNWAQIDDALRNISARKACLQMTVWDVFGLGYVTTFDATRCR